MPEQTGRRITRRDFLEAGALSAIGLSSVGLGATGLTRPGLPGSGSRDAGGRNDESAAILIFNAGAPSHLDTFDMKPDAPREIRGPFRPIRTRSAGIWISELFPLHARCADRFSLVRGVHHEAAPVHETGHQLMQSGWLPTGGVAAPHAGSAVSYLCGGRRGLPAYVLLPGPMGPTGVDLPNGQGAGFLGPAHDPFVAGSDPSRAARARSGPLARALDLSGEPRAVRERYGRTRFGECCLRARRLVETGVRFVTINTFVSVFNRVTWDAHGSRPFSSLEDMRDFVAPMYDRAYSALLEDLHQRGMLESTLLCSLSECGRTPRLNPAGGRDHWPHCWTVYFAGGGVQGGRVVGRSDEIGAFVEERPVEPAEVVATIYRSLGVDLEARLSGPDSRPAPLLPPGVREIRELF
jgi:hypothetical protein